MIWNLASGTPTRSRRRGASAVELAIILPILSFIMVAALDYARVLYYAVITVNCARNGAMYASNPSASYYYTNGGLNAAALADYQFSTNTPTVASTTGVDASGNNYVRVTVTYTFQTILNYPGIPQTVTLAQSVTIAKSS